MDTIGFRGDTEQPEKKKDAGMQRSEIPEMLVSIREKLNEITDVLDEQSPRDSLGFAETLPENGGKSNLVRFPGKAGPRAPQPQESENGENFSKRLENIEVLLGELLRSKYAAQTEAAPEVTEEIPAPVPEEPAVFDASVHLDDFPDPVFAPEADPSMTRAPEPTGSVRPAKVRPTETKKLRLPQDFRRNVLLQTAAMALFFGACALLRILL